MGSFSRFFLRFRYPVTLPEDIAKALGINVSNHVSFDEFLGFLTNPRCSPTTLEKFMPRNKAENAFKDAQRKDCFRHNSLFSYYFAEGWVEFKLEFDSEERLRRMYILNQRIQEDRGAEIPLAIHG